MGQWSSELRGVEAGPFVLEDLHVGVFPADGGGVVRGKAVDDENFFGRREDVLQAAADVKFLILGKDDDGEVELGSAERALFDELGRIPAHHRPWGHVPEDGAAGSHHGSRAYCHPHAHEGLRRHPGPVFHGDGGGDEGVAGV